MLQEQVRSSVKQHFQPALYANVRNADQTVEIYGYFKKSYTLPYKDECQTHKCPDKPWKNSKVLASAMDMILHSSLTPQNTKIPRKGYPKRI